MAISLPAVWRMFRVVCRHRQLPLAATTAHTMGQSVWHSLTRLQLKTVCLKVSDEERIANIQARRMSILSSSEKDLHSKTCRQYGLNGTMAVVCVCFGAGTVNSNTCHFTRSCKYSSYILVQRKHTHTHAQTHTLSSSSGSGGTFCWIIRREIPT